MRNFRTLTFLTLLLAASPSRPIDLRPDGSWVPEVKFDLDGSSPDEALMWVSGWSYALTFLAREQARAGGNRLFCPPHPHLVESRVMLTILNEVFEGQKVTTDQASVALWERLTTAYPCAPAR
jgi:hypothetical protein